MEKLLTGLKIEHWYHLFITLGAAGALAAMTIELKAVANAHALLMSLGVLLIGVGEWINHPKKTKLMRPNLHTGGLAAKITSHPRAASLLGVAFDLAGGALIALAIYQIVKAA